MPRIHSRKPITKKIRFEVLKRDGFACRYCGARPPQARLQVDHIHPVSDLGGNWLNNLAAACQDCNLGKGTILLEDWMPRQKDILRLQDLVREKFSDSSLSVYSLLVLCYLIGESIEQMEKDIVEWEPALKNDYLGNLESVIDIYIKKVGGPV